MPSSLRTTTLLVALTALACLLPAGAAQAVTRAAFYYPWFPETWGKAPYNTDYHPTLGYYDAGSPALIGRHIAALQYAGQEAGIASWWGQGTRTDARVPALLSAARAAGTGFAWTLYYECEGASEGGCTGIGPDPSAAQISADLAYIKSRYAGDPAFLKLGGKPVIFAYGNGGDGCAGVTRWKQANASAGFHVVLKVFTGYRSCADQPGSWHQYAPAKASDHQAGQSFAISPGFSHYKDPDPCNSPRSSPYPCLPRDLERWKADIRAMVASRAPWQLVTTFNEWGEGTAVESASEWASSSGHGLYLDALNAVIGPAGGGPAASAAPRLHSLRISPRAFRAARSGRSVAAARRAAGARVRYRLSRAALVRFRVQRRGRGGRYRTLRSSFRHRGATGRNRFRFSGRLRGVALHAGRYRLVATPSGAGGRGKPRRAAFRIRR